jgi:signal transduction histidine kinase
VLGVSMIHHSTPTAAGGQARPRHGADSRNLSEAILRWATRGLPRLDFLREVSGALLDFTGCDAVEIRLHDGDLHYRWLAEPGPQPVYRFEPARWPVRGDGAVIPAFPDATAHEHLCRRVAEQDPAAAEPGFTPHGSFWTGVFAATATAPATPTGPGAVYPSCAILRVVVSDDTIGLLLLKSKRPQFFTLDEVTLYEDVAQTLGLAMAARRAEAALRERVKELTCLYGIAQVAEEPDLSLEASLRRIVDLLPAAWQYPETAAARITLDDQAYATAGFQLTGHRQTADILVRGQPRGAVDVVYLEDLPELAAGSFLPEEEKLIDAVAREIAVIVERGETREDQVKLQHQLIHADRLATIGLLAAGVAHELNEPLGGILGFAQLAQKSAGLPTQARQDIQKIVTAALYAREVIKKLMVFARQMPPRKTQVNLNRVAEDVLVLVGARCAKAGIDVVRDLAPDLPEITADPAQLNQVLINLVVNAVQAMPQRGTLTVRTRPSTAAVLLQVQDTGVGMSPEVLEKAFLPFFTTKDVNEGTGLGLAVVHGIVTAHGGTIRVDSSVQTGTCFEIRLPVVSPEPTEEVAADGIVS